MSKKRRVNRLPRKSISSGKVTGKVKYNTDISLVTDSAGCITDNLLDYYESKFQFSDFYNKEIQGHDWINKPRFLLEAKKGKYYSNTETGVELAFRDLISYYYDLDQPLERLYNGYHDSMFVRFSLKIGMFTTRRHWEMVMRGWSRGFTEAVRVYYNYIHPKYDPSSGMPYTVFFDTFFSNRLYFEILDIEYNNKDDLAECREIIRLDQVNVEHYSNLLEELSYSINDLDLNII